jgi:hypothetical protein
VPDEIRSTLRAVMSFVDPATDLPITSHLRNKAGRHAAAAVGGDSRASRGFLSLPLISFAFVSSAISRACVQTRALGAIAPVCPSLFQFFLLSNLYHLKGYIAVWRLKFNLRPGATAAQSKPGGSPGRRRGEGCTS